MPATATGSIAIDAGLQARFAEALARLNPGGGRLGLAVSGGPDSMAMLLLAHAVIPGGFAVGTVDHGLRPEAQAECAAVARACAMRGVDCAILTARMESGNLQADARRARYAVLGQWSRERGLAALATAHHADDQAETLLMRLARGSGVAGLAGIREAGRVEGVDVPVIRPLLSFRRAELARVIAAGNIAVAHDPSNTDDRFDRVRLRKWLTSGVGEDGIGPLPVDVLALARSAGHLAEADEALEAFTDLAWRDHVTCEDGAIRFHPLVPRAIRLRVAGRIFAQFGACPRGGEVARLVDRLETGGGGNLAGVLARAEAGAWAFRPEPPRRAG